MPTVHLLVKGKVQGVFFRASAKEKAGSLELRGWVKNTPAGDVEIAVSGSDENLQQFIGWCGRGPANAVVTSVIVTPLGKTTFEDFRIVPK